MARKEKPKKGEVIVSQVPQSPDNPNNISFEQRAKELEKEDKAEQERLKREKNSVYKEWYQTNLQPEYAKMDLWLIQNHPKAKAILTFLVQNMDNYNSLACSYETIQTMLDMSKSTVTRSIKILKDYGFIAIHKMGTANIYSVNHDLYWKSWGKNIKYSKFPMIALVLESEQDEKKPTLKIDKHKEVSVKED